MNLLKNKFSNTLKHRVLITGITGFIGSKIAEVLCDNQLEVIGLKRKKSDVWRCKDFADKVNWLDIDGYENWKDLVVNRKPNIIIHAAWIGVESFERNNYLEQIKNIDFIVDLLTICESVKVDKFIFLGSQAEYGIVNAIACEDDVVKPISAYGAIKVASLEILRAFCSANDINWIWLRVFSVFGEKENRDWLIPSLIRNMQISKQMDFTFGEQIYAYLYIFDLANIIHQITIKKIKSGIYNISSNESVKLKRLIEQIRDVVNKDFILNFGAIPYRKNQSMHIQGDISRIVNQIGSFPFTNFNVALQNTINYYKKQDLK